MSDIKVKLFSTNRNLGFVTRNTCVSDMLLSLSGAQITNNYCKTSMHPSCKFEKG
jgi:hypothetical protein